MIRRSMLHIAARAVHFYDGQIILRMMVVLAIDDDDGNGIISVGEAYRSCPRWLSLMRNLSQLPPNIFYIRDYLCWRSLPQLPQVVISYEKLIAVAT